MSDGKYVEIDTKRNTDNPRVDLKYSKKAGI